jgi:uncharacterized membrane protein YeaQ/YmgE (transglycosylase-associated protein family)
MLILAIILFGMLAGAAAQFLLGRERGRVDWTMAFIAGLAGSFVGGLLVSLLAGDGLDLRPSGIIGSIGGAVIVTAIWRWMRNRSAAPTKSAASRSGNPAKRNQAK